MFYNHRLPRRYRPVRGWRAHRPYRKRRHLSRPRYRYNPYRRNLVSLARRKELIAESPGNFRRPTLAATKEYLDEWAGVGIESADDWDAMSGFWPGYAAQVEVYDSPELAEALTKNRYEEAQHYWRPYKAAQDLYESDPENHPQPEFTQPVLGSVDAAREDFRDFGDYSPISKKQAHNYLYQFLTRNAEKPARERDDAREAPYKWRYRDAVLTLGPKKATDLIKEVFKRAGKRAPKWYLPDNLYDDLDTLFPEGSETEADETEAEPEVTEVVDEEGNEIEAELGPDPLAASPFRRRRRNPAQKCKRCHATIRSKDPRWPISILEPEKDGYYCQDCFDVESAETTLAFLEDTDDHEGSGYSGAWPGSPFRRRRNPGWTFKNGKAIPHDRELDEMYPTQKRRRRLRRRRRNPWW